MRNTKILISGASIAGPVLAYWLAQHGCQPVVVERAPEMRRGGQAIDIRGVALSVLDRMGIIDEVRAGRTDMRGMSMVDKSGKTLFSTTEFTFTGGATGNEDIEIMRDDLVKILHRITAETTEYRYGDHITALEETDDGVHVTFANGEPEKFDLVVGADGVRSGVRKLAFGQDSRFLRPMNIGFSIFSADNFLDLDRWQIFHRSGNMMMGIHTARQNTESRILLSINMADSSVDPHDPEQQKQLLVEKFTGAGWESRRFLEKMWQSPDFYFDSLNQVVMDSWTNGRVALVGDAGYGPSPRSGQGTSLALVGAYVLAGELAVADGDHQAAFARYNTEIRDYVLRNQALAHDLSRKMGDSNSRLGTWLQTQALRAVTRAPFLGKLLPDPVKGLSEATFALNMKNYESTLTAQARAR